MKHQIPCHFLAFLIAAVAAASGIPSVCRGDPGKLRCE